MLRKLGALLLLLSVAACAGTPGEAELKTSAASVAKPSTSAYLAAGDATRKDGRFAEALQIYQEILVSDPTAVAAQYGVAECLLGLGKPDEARPMFEALAKDPQFHPVGLQGQGLALLALGKREEAAKSLRAATEADPALWRSWNGLGYLADLKRDAHEAEAAYSRALAADPDSAVLHNNLGYSRLRAGKPDEALAEFRKAYGLDPTSETVRNNIRIALAAKGSYAAALHGVPPNQMATVLNNVGYVAMEKGDLAAAEGYLARAMENSPSFNTIAAQNIDRLKAEKGDDQ
jgi:Flp pilus assembly protein TadD